MSKETAIINIRVAWVDTQKSINCFANLMKTELKYSGRAAGTGRIRGGNLH